MSANWKAECTLRMDQEQRHLNLRTTSGAGSRKPGYLGGRPGGNNISDGQLTVNGI